VLIFTLKLKLCNFKFNIGDYIYWKVKLIFYEPLKLDIRYSHVIQQILIQQFSYFVVTKKKNNTNLTDFSKIII